jgi:hypothetical protein
VASGVNDHYGFTILDVSNPKKPNVVNRIEDEGRGRNHKVLLVDDVLIINRDMGYAISSGVDVPDSAGGLRLFDITDPVNPKFIKQVHTEGRGIHRPTYDRKRKLLYSSGDKDGFRDRILFVHDMKDPRDPELIGLGWVPGQHESEPFPIKSDIPNPRLWIHESHPFGNYVTSGCVDGGIAMFDLTDPSSPKFMRPKDTSWCLMGSRYGAHNLWQWMTAEDLLYISWFNAGLRIVDWSNPFEPKEVGHYIPAGNSQRFCPQSNEVFVDRSTGLIYLSDRWGLGLHILEFTG